MVSFLSTWGCLALLALPILASRQISLSILIDWWQAAHIFFVCFVCCFAAILAPSGIIVAAPDRVLLSPEIDARHPRVAMLRRLLCGKQEWWCGYIGWTSTSAPSMYIHTVPGVLLCEHVRSLGNSLLAVSDDDDAIGMYTECVVSSSSVNWCEVFTSHILQVDYCSIATTCVTTSYISYV